MKKSSLSIIFFISIFIFSGCSAIMTSIGDSKINNSIKTYRNKGLTSAGMSELISGLDYSPNSVVGINEFKIQYNEISAIKNKILTKKNHTENDIDNLNLYLLTVEEFRKINPKIPTIKVDYNDFNNSKIKINQIFEKYVERDERFGLDRYRKLQKINYYNSLLNYINNYTISSIVKDLENQVTINLYIGSSFRGFSQLDTLMTNALISAADQNINRNLGNYIFFRGYSYISKISSNNFFINIDFTDIDIVTLETSVDENNGNKTFFKRKKVFVSGVYKIYNNTPFPSIKPFSFKDTYTIKTKKNDNSVYYDDERAILREILENNFSDMIRYDIKNLRF
ncbi:hypothetical protein H5J22_03290 [Cetobacterium sp. 8H]|uniref:hypothetical protein n=1 Tax=Cetobacterium sp. 8H TaxID=2759681 RepID=UPI00163BF0D9|nr:hypothetical protein [Cetobacterium sp. 8H]MBC2850469.1 hypothetical protein [Cetobacterium sp. 8H]